MAARVTYEQMDVGIDDGDSRDRLHATGRRRFGDNFVQQFDLVDYDETLVYAEEIVSGKPVDIRVEVERHFDANVVIWSEPNPPVDWGSDEPGAYVDLHRAPDRVERVDQNHVKYFLNLRPGGQLRTK
jgi:hypothetical protein